MSRSSSALAVESARRERKLRCFFGITTGRTPDRERALAESTFRSSGSFPRVNRKHLLWLAIRDLARNRLPFTLTTHGYSASLGIIAERVVKSFDRDHLDQSRLHTRYHLSVHLPLFHQLPRDLELGNLRLVSSRMRHKRTVTIEHCKCVILAESLFTPFSHSFQPVLHCFLSFQVTSLDTFKNVADYNARLKRIK